MSRPSGRDEIPVGGWSAHAIPAGDEAALVEAEAALAEAMAALAPEGVLLACRAIRAKDEGLLLPEEARALTTRDPAARRASGAARHAARALLVARGHPSGPVLRSPFGAPLWPEGIVGSLAHDDGMAVAAVASARAARSLGIDVEPAAPLPEELSGLVVTPADGLGTGAALSGRLVFAAKEALYKAVHPLTGEVLDYGDIAVNLPEGTARARSGHVARLSFCLAPRVVVLAVIPCA